MTASHLLALARSQQHEDLETAWEQELQRAGEAGHADVADYRDALVALGKNDAAGLAIDLGNKMVDALDGAGKKGEAIELGLGIVALELHGDSFARQLLDKIKAHYSSAAWFSIAMSESNLDGIEDPTPKRFAAFDRVRRYDAGNAIYHRSGWGEGVVEEFRADTKDIIVRFASGRTTDFPLSTALETFTPLDADDLRSMRMQQLEELQRMAEEEPASLIRKTAKMMRGRVNSVELKAELMPTVIASSKWAGWWKKAKAAAAHDPWLQIEGSKARPQFVLRQRPVSLTDEAERAIKQTLSLDEAMGVVREFLARKLDSEAEQVVLELAAAQTNNAIERQQNGDEKAPSHASILDAILLVEQRGQSCSISASEELHRLLLDEEGNFDPAGLGQLKSQAARDHAVTMLPDALGETWSDQCIARLLDFPAHDVEGVVTLLSNAKRAGELVAIWPDVAPYPRRHPVLTYLLGRLYADGFFDESPDCPEVISVGRVMLNLGRVLALEGRGNQMMTRLKSRISNLLVGRRQLLDRCLEDISRNDLAAYLAIVERAGEDFPQEVTDAILRAVARKFPDLTSRPERPWWEREDAIFVTKDGLARYREEHRVLVDVKIPENAKAIEHAASYGDLSENSEWEAAMEEQRNLTGKAQDMSREIEIAKLIDEQDIPEGVVVPGVRVKIIDSDGDESREMRILGPWDCIEPDIINYQAPLAAALLGHKSGDDVDVPSKAGGMKSMRIDEIERII